MLEKLFDFKLTDEKIIEKIIDDENVNINHVILLKGDALPEHYSNSNVYLIIAHGTITLQLDDQDNHSYPRGSIVNVPFKTKMNVSNKADEKLEFFIVKSPSPSQMKG